MSGPAVCPAPLERDAAADRRTARVHFSLEEKLRIVSEALGDGMRQAHVTRKYGLGKNTLARWKQVLGPLCVAQPAVSRDDPAGELGRLLARVAELERLLGQRTLELDALRRRLQQVRLATPIAQDGPHPARAGAQRTEGRR